MLTLRVDDYDVDFFAKAASAFGTENYGYVVTANADHIIRLHEDALFRDVYDQASFVLLDSRFVKIVLWLFAALRLRTCPGSDLTEKLFASVIGCDDVVVLIGSSIAQAEVLRKRYGLSNLRQHIPPMGLISDTVAVESCLSFIETQVPFRFCLIAVGTPQGEYIAHELKRRKRSKGLAVCIGASVNFLTGVERRAPQWMRRFGFEWLFRLASNPRRLARRYLLRGPRIFWLLFSTRFVRRPRSS